MGVRYARVGFGVAAAGQVAYLPEQTTVPAFLLGIATAVGFALAAGARERGAMLLAGIGLAAFAALVNTFLALGLGFDIWFAPQALFAVGLLMCLGGAGPRGHDFGVRAGAATAAFGSALWLLLDPFNMVSGWLPGNLLNVAGLALVAGGFHTEVPATEATEAPA